jgi:hypothetical protein
MVTLSILLRENTNKKSIIHVKNTLFKNFRRQSVFFCAKSHTCAGKVLCWGKFGGKIARYRFLLLHFLVK